ncbi:MAG: PaaI family thioesterase [Acidimicrobiales bacterium]
MTDQTATALVREAMPLAATLGLRAERYTPEAVVLALDWSPELCTSNGLLHGGAIMALADSAGGACAFLNLPEDASGTSTIESKTNFVGGVRNGAATATATVLHRGRTTIVIETSVRDGSDVLVAKVTQTQIVLRARN